jgi:hypothetical protein
MDNVAYRTFENVPVSQKPHGIPPLWPRELSDLGDSDELPPGEGWILATRAEYEAHRSSLQDEYDAFVAANPNQLTLMDLNDLKLTEIQSTMRSEVRAFEIESRSLGLYGSVDAVAVSETMRPTLSAMLTFQPEVAESYLADLQANTAVHVPVFLTAARLTDLRNRIRLYLNLPPV